MQHEMWSLVSDAEQTSSVDHTRTELPAQHRCQTLRLAAELEDTHLRRRPPSEPAALWTKYIWTGISCNICDHIFTLAIQLIAESSTGKSHSYLVKSSSLKCFFLDDHGPLEQISVPLVVTKVGSGCCRLPLTYTEEEKRLRVCK